MREKEFGEQIRKLRTAKKMTLAVMAERVGVTTSSIAAYENGSRTPSVEILIKIANLFHVSTDKLLGYSSTETLDVTDLNEDQKNSVREMVLGYRKLNEAMGLLKRNNLALDSELSRNTPSHRINNKDYKG